VAPKIEPVRSVSLLCVLSLACTEPASWGLAFDDPSVAGSAVLVEARVHDGGCDGPVRYREEIAPGRTDTMPLVLPEGLFGLAGEARNTDCEVIASGCVLASFPAQSAARFEVRLVSEPLPARPVGCSACEAARCISGCVSGCERLVPSNVGDAVAMDAGAAAIVVGDDAFVDWSIDTETGAIVATDPLSMMTREVRESGTGVRAGIAFVVVSQSGGAPALGVFAIGSLDVRSGATLRAGGGSPLVVLAAAEVVVDGTISVAPTGEGPGAGGGRGGAGGGTAGTGLGGGASGMPALPSPGGGGASFGGTGGSGGTGTAAGATYGAADLVPLLGGSGGGGGESAGGNGGHGGGAVHLAAGGRIEIRGVVDACGAGGQGGQTSTGSGGGGGGGSGGAILLEAPVVLVRGFLGANGGAGGQGTQERWNVVGNDGADGDAARAPAVGSPTTGSGGGGGDGSAAGGAAFPGAAAAYAGGGGGGAGRIRVNTRSGTEALDRGVLPSPSSGLSTVGRAAFEVASVP
jgi:hypothetical protein